MQVRRRLDAWVFPVLGAALLSTLVASPSSAASRTWSWRATGIVGHREDCSKVGERLSSIVCGFHVPNAPRLKLRETGVVRFVNTTARAKCYGLSISTSYMAGLRSICVKARSTGRLTMSGPALQFRSTQLSIFVTSGSTSTPIAPLRDRDSSRFTIIFSEALS